MDGSSSREGGLAMKPTILRVGVALVLSATGLILAKFIYRKEDNEVTSFTSNQEPSSSPQINNEGEEQKQEILTLQSRFEGLQKKEQEMEMRFERYCFLKDQEMMLIEYKSMLSLEKSQLGFLSKEVTAMEEEHKRGQDLVMVYLKMVGKIQEVRTQNGFLEGQAKKLKKRTKKLYNVVKEKNMRSISLEKEFLRCLDEVEKKNNIVKELEEEVKDLKANVDVLQKEKEEVFKKVSNSKPEMVSVEDYKRVIEEYEGLKKDLANGVSEEVISLRWSNACLRHKVKTMMMMRNENSYGETLLSPNENLQELCLEDQTDAMALTVASSDEHHEENHHHNHHESSRRKRLMKKLKRWVEGNDKGRRHSLTVEPEEEEHMFHSRRSCSSV